MILVYVCIFFDTHVIKNSKFFNLNVIGKTTFIYSIKKIWF